MREVDRWAGGAEAGAKLHKEEGGLVALSLTSCDTPSKGKKEQATRWTHTGKGKRKSMF